MRGRIESGREPKSSDRATNTSDRRAAVPDGMDIRLCLRRRADRGEVLVLDPRLPFGLRQARFVVHYRRHRIEAAAVGDADTGRGGLPVADTGAPPYSRRYLRPSSPDAQRSNTD